MHGQRKRGGKGSEVKGGERDEERHAARQRQVIAQGERVEVGKYRLATEEQRQRKARRTPSAWEKSLSSAVVLGFWGSEGKLGRGGARARRA